MNTETQRALWKAMATFIDDLCIANEYERQDIIDKTTEWLMNTANVFTDAELRARDERIIWAARRVLGLHGYYVHRDDDAIIAAAEADQ